MNGTSTKIVLPPENSVKSVTEEGISTNLTINVDKIL
jgi:hypothetical protein